MATAKNQSFFFQKNSLFWLSIPKIGGTIKTNSIQTDTSSTGIMLSPRIFKGIKLFMRIFSSYLGAMPFSWCHNTKLFVESKRAKYSCSLNLFLFIIWNSFLLCQIFRFYQLKDYNRLNLLVAFITATLIALEALVLPIRYNDLFMLEINSMLVYLQRIQGLYIPQLPKYDL